MIQWSYADCVTFSRSRDEFGSLSNRASYPIILGHLRVPTIEHLYQALRFSHAPSLQQDIFALPHPLLAKRYAYRHRAATRSDWEEVKSDMMFWCLELKYVQHPDTFGQLLLATDHRKIVEASRDDYWGAKPVANGDQPPAILRGWNVLGRLWMLMRRKIEINSPFDLRSAVIEIPNFRLLGIDAIELAISERTV